MVVEVLREVPVSGGQVMKGLIHNEVVALSQSQLKGKYSKALMSGDKLSLLGDFTY